MNIGKITFLYQCVEFRFSYIGLVNSEVKELIDEFHKNNPHIEDVKLEFTKALILGKIPDCKVIDIDLRR